MKFLIFTLSFFICILSVSAQIPRSLSYQGILTDNQGNVLPDGNRSLTIKIYDELNAVAPLYTETQNVNVVKGLFNIVIGTINPIPNNITFNGPLFLGVSVDFGQEMSPRTALTSVPYALNAQTAAIAQQVAPGATGIVTSVNGIQGNVTLVGGGGTTVNQSGNTVTISSTGVGNGIQGIQNSDGTMSIQNVNGPIATIGLNNNAVTGNHIQNGTITTSDFSTNGVNENMVIKFRNGSWQTLPAKVINVAPEFQLLGNSITDDVFLSLRTNGVPENSVLKFRNGSWQYLQGLKLTAGSGIGFSNINAGTDDITISALDASPTNEIQNLSYNAGTNVLSISNGNSVDLSDLDGGGSSQWTTSGNNIFANNAGNVGIGTNSPTQKLSVVGNMRLQGGLFLGSAEQIVDGGANTIAINSHFRPDATNLRDLGTDAARWKDIYLRGSVFFGTAEKIFDGGSNTIAINSHFRPEANNMRDLGTSAVRWKDIYLRGSVFFGSAERIFDGGSNTIAINSHFRPDIDATRDLGTSATKFRNLHVSGSVFFGNTETLSDGGASTIATNSTLRPTTTGVRDLGTSTLKFRDIYLSGKIRFGTAESLVDGGANTIQSDSHIVPEGSNTSDLGKSTQRWRRVYLNNQPDVSSDIRLKDNITDLKYGLTDVLKLRPVSYFLKADETKATQLGLLAQEVQTIIPSIVHGDASKEMLSIAYAELIPVLINAIKDQQKEIESLKNAQQVVGTFTAAELQLLKSMVSQAQVQK